MADFTISAKIIMEAAEAIKASDQLKSDMSEMASETSTTSRKTQIDVKKMTASFALLGATAGSALAAIIAASPSMTVAMMEMQFALREVALAIGEDLAPIIDEYLVPIIEGFRDFILSLNPEIRQWIGLTILLTVAISAVALAVAALSAVSLPLVAIILAIAAVVAAIIIIWRKWNEIIAWAQENTGKFILIIAALAVVFGPIVLVVLAVIAVLKNLGTIIEWLKGLWEAFSDTVVGQFLIQAVEKAMAVVKGVINTIIGWLNDNIIAFINDHLIANVNKIMPKKWKIGNVPNIPSLAVGLSYVPKDMPAMLHQGERVLTREENKRMQAGSGTGGGDTYHFNNTFKIGSVMDRQMIRMIASEVETVQARQQRRRGLR